MKRLKSTLIAAASVLAVSAIPSQATVWTFTEVQGPNLVDSGFGYSSAHDSSGSNVMSGSTLVHFGASNTSASSPLDADGFTFGTYDDVTGNLSVVMYMFAGTGANQPAIGALTLTGTLGPTWSGNGGLGALSYKIEFTPGTHAFETHLMNNGVSTDVNGNYVGSNLLFNQGDQCCSGGATDPNSFVTSGSTATMTLWGATGDPNSTNSNGKYQFANSVFGTDFRFSLTEGGNQTSVPEPMTLSLFGIGLAGLGLGIRRRRD